jgi:hypothetical protein
MNQRMGTGLIPMLCYGLYRIFRFPNGTLLERGSIFRLFVAAKAGQIDLRRNKNVRMSIPVTTN